MAVYISGNNKYWLRKHGIYSIWIHAKNEWIWHSYIYSFLIWTDLSKYSSYFFIWPFPAVMHWTWNILLISKVNVRRFIFHLDNLNEKNLPWLFPWRLSSLFLTRHRVAYTALPLLPLPLLKANVYLYLRLVSCWCCQIKCFHYFSSVLWYPLRFPCVTMIGSFSMSFVL